MPTMEAWNPPPPFPSGNDETEFPEVASMGYLREQRRILNGLEALYARTVKRHGASLPLALWVRDMLQVVRKKIRTARRDLLRLKLRWQ